MNITKVIDCIDYDNAEYKSLPDGKIMFFTKYAFIEDKVKNQHIFKIPEFKTSRFFVSDEFKKRVEDTGMKGFEFRLLWDSEAE